MAAVPNPSGLGYVVPRLRRSGFLPVALEYSRGNSRLLVSNAAPEVRQIPLMANVTTYMDSLVVTQTLKPRPPELKASAWIQTAPSN